MRLSPRIVPPTSACRICKVCGCVISDVGFHLGHDHTVNDDLRFVQLTPPGSACSIAIGKGMRGLQLVVSDINAARADLFSRGVEVGEVQTFPWGAFVFFHTIPMETPGRCSRYVRANETCRQ